MTPADVLICSAIIAFFGVVISAFCAAITAWEVAKRTSSNTIFQVRATVRTGYRTRWLEEFRESVTTLLYLGQQVHSPLAGAPQATLDERRELRKRAAHLVVLLGRGTQHPGADARPKLAELARVYADAPSRELDGEIEELMQEVFSERWSQVFKETGELPEPAAKPMGWLTRTARWVTEARRIHRHSDDMSSDGR